MDNISVIIRNRNEAEYIGFAIQSVLDHLPENKIEVIICDNESTDDSMEVVSLFNDRLDIRNHSISKKDYTPGKALNQCFNEVSYDKVLVMSAHCQITNLNLYHRRRGILHHLENHAAVMGKQLPIYRGKKISRRYIWANFKDSSIPIVNPISSNESRLFLHNAFCFYKLEAVLEIPFDETLSGKEDRYWAQELDLNGGTFVYEPDMICNHMWTGNGATWRGLG